MKILDLNGTWTLSGRNAEGADFSLAGEVPGCVHTDLLKNGLLPDLFYRDNSKYCQWIENENFTYERAFTVTELRENAVLCFDGLDTYCTVLLNGRKIGECADMHTPFAFPVDGILRAGENVLRVLFRSPIKEVADCPKRSGAFTTERMNTRRIQCTYLWDWVDRFVTMGIYRPCRIEFRESNEIESCYVYSSYVSEAYAQLKLSLRVRNFARNGDEIAFTLTNAAGKTVFAKKRAILEPLMEDTVTLRDPDLWFPNGYGKQPLYTLTLATPTHTVTQQIGIRRLTILQPVDEPDSEYAEISRKLKEADFLKNKDFNTETSGFTLLCNGVPIMCKGANWVPCEPFPSAETPEKIDSLLRLAKAGNVNMLRVWGGGIFERDEFYALCDRYGILVTQDFLMACGRYPEDEPWFIEALQKEARAAALRLRNHACLAWWSGDNENAVHGSENRADFDGYRAATYGILPALRELDPMRDFLASSPYGGDFYCSATRGTTHNTYFLGNFFKYCRESDFSDYREYFSLYFNRFNAEQPAMGMPFLSSLRKFLTYEDIFGDDTAMSEFHTKNNPGLGAITLYGYVERMSQGIFGKFRGGADRVRKMQYLHCEWVRFSMEPFRRRKWYSSGIVYWMYNDCWAAANGWSIVDYYADPKPAYYVFADRAKPVIASVERADDKLRVYICTDGLTGEIDGTGRLYLYDFNAKKTLFSHVFDYFLPENESRIVFEMPVESYDRLRTADTILLADITANGGKYTDRAFFVNDRYADLALTYADPIASVSGDTATVTAETFLPFAVCDFGRLASENCFPMLPGEKKNVTLQS